MNDELGKQIVEQMHEVAKQVREVDGSLTVSVLMLFVIAMFMLLVGQMECNTKTATTSEDQCLADCNRRAAQPEHAAERTRYNNRECWCFDEKTGETTRLW